VTAAPSIIRNGRRVVLKRIDDDCLLDGVLHPSIKLRLERIRELPLKSVANLHGVERIDGVACLVWEFVPGTPLAELQSSADVDWHRLAREVVLAVEELHGAGIVHGAIHERNVIVDDTTGEIRLTHVSPLLYTEPDQDAQDVAIMLADLVIAQGDESPLAEMLAGAASGPITTAEVYARLAALNVDPKLEPAVERKPTLRTRSLAWAVIVAMIGIAVAAGVAWHVAQTEERPIAPPAARTVE
jgi:hypothetical protein